jgi:type III secretory pathway lipoprotein EscJ
MARFYDTISDSELNQVVALLKEHGVGYTLRPAAGSLTEMIEILVAEEDLAWAERLLADQETASISTAIDIDYRLQ